MFEEALKAQTSASGQDDLMEVIPVIKSVGELYSAVASSVLDADYTSKIEDFKLKWTRMASVINITTPPKVHIIITHIRKLAILIIFLINNCLEFYAVQHLPNTSMLDKSCQFVGS